MQGIQKKRPPPPPQSATPLTGKGPVKMVTFGAPTHADGSPSERADREEAEEAEARKEWEGRMQQMDHIEAKATERLKDGRETAREAELESELERHPWELDEILTQILTLTLTHTPN